MILATHFLLVFAFFQFSTSEATADYNPVNIDSELDYTNSLARSIRSLKNNNNNLIDGKIKVNAHDHLTPDESSKLTSSLLADQNETKAGKYEKTNRIATTYIWPVVPICFAILGTIANILSIIVFTRKEMRKFSSFCYFAVLNGVNLAFLYVTTIRAVMEFNFDTDIRRLSLFSCKTHLFLTYFLSHLSSMLLCMISIDRVISVMFLRKAKEVCTPKTAFWVSVGLMLFNFLLSCHFLVFDSGYIKYIYQIVGTEIKIELTQRMPYNSTIRLVDTKVECDSIEGTIYNVVVQHVWKIVDMSIYAFIPFTIMLICSVIIIVRVASQAQKFNKNKKAAAAAHANKNATKAEQEMSTAPAPQNLRKASLAPTSVKSVNDAKFNSRTRNLALMLIPVNILFLLFLAPVVLTMYLYKDLAKDQLTLAIVELISHCNFTLNFFIYFLTSSKFREEFYKFLNEVVAVFSKRVTGSSTKNLTMRKQSNIGGDRPATIRLPPTGTITKATNNGECVALTDVQNEKQK